MNDLFPSPSAGFDHPLEILSGCHERVRRNCALVVRIARYLQDEGFDEEVRVAAGSVIRYFDIAGRDHHRDEEDDLFPALLDAASGPTAVAIRALVARLRADHVALEACWAEVRGRLQDIHEGRREGTLEAGLAEHLQRLYDDHIVEEESVLLPLARRCLPPDVIARLGRSMAARRGVTGTPRSSRRSSP